MKPAPFGYSRPDSVAEALSTLDSLAGEAKVLAGGQSLLPLLSMRLATPAHLVDINHLHELSYVRVDDECVEVGALARHAEVHRHGAAAAAQPLLRKALGLVAHPTIRNRGTTVGSIVHADPSGEMTAVLALLGATVRVASAAGHRDIAAEDFFLGPLESAVGAGDLAVSASFPVLPPGAGTAFMEVSRRNGDYAVCGAAVLAQLDDEGRVRQARAAYLSVAPTPLVLDLTDAVGGQAPGTLDLDGAAALAVAGVDPEPDIHATAEYRRHLVGVLTKRALAQACSEAALRSAA
jgi:aerobic carbon-monoxide dehydrogenase medium subunit